LLVERYAWLRMGQAPEVGPLTVDAGECDRCGREPRLVEVCGPLPWTAIGRRCASELGAQAWCDGHAEQADRNLRTLRGLPAEADVVARLWWVATGEVRPIGPAAGALAAEVELITGTSSDVTEP
jgi:hypothetical protein